MGVAVFWLEPIGRARLSLRRYADGACPRGSYHNAALPLFDVEERKVPDGDGPRDWVYHHDGPQTPEDVFPTYEWPTHCACGYVFREDSTRQVFSDHLYKRVDTGEIQGLRAWDRVPGAMWNAEWLATYDRYQGADGRCLHVVCPNGQTWCIDGPANNCTMPNDTIHKCWVRHGEPPNITVDKNGFSCAAGAGSIQAGDYHGFLRGGVFEP